MKIGIIGAGRIGKVHIRNISLFVPGDVETPVTGMDGLYPVLMAAAATKSLKEGRPVKISEIE